MSRQRRQDPEQKPAEEKHASTAGAVSREVDAEAQVDDEGSEPPAPVKSPPPKLPAFGFAADFLANRQTTASSEAQQSSDAVGEEPRGKGSRSDDPGTIFAFADSLTAAEKDEEERRVQARITTWITFDLADETFAVPVEPVREVLRIHNITRVPHAPYPIRGVTNLRGRVIPVIDLRRRVGLREGEIGRLARIIIVLSRGRLIGLLVDQVHQVMHLDLNLVQQPPDDVMTVQSDYISGVYHFGEQLLLLLDVDRALTLHDGAEAQISGAA